MTISKLYQNSIQKKIGFSLVAIITCILTLFGIYRYFVIKSESTRGIHDLATITIERLAEHLVIPMWDIDQELVEKTILAYLMDKRIYAIVVQDEEGCCFWEESAMRIGASLKPLSEPEEKFYWWKIWTRFSN